MREHKSIGVVLPVGPKDVEAACDTLASALYYLDDSRVIVVVDDSGRHAEFAARVRELSPEIVVLPARRARRAGSAGSGSRLPAAISGFLSGITWILSCGLTPMP